MYPVVTRADRTWGHADYDLKLSMIFKCKMLPITSHHRFDVVIIVIVMSPLRHRDHTADSGRGREARPSGQGQPQVQPGEQRVLGELVHHLLEVLRRVR